MFRYAVWTHNVESARRPKILPCVCVDENLTDKKAHGNLTCFCLSEFISNVNWDKSLHHTNEYKMQISQ